MTITVTLPFTLINGTLADATQVMANYQVLVNGFTLAASAGANNDITSLTGLTTPLAPNFGGSPVFVGGVTTGSANSQVLASVLPANFSLTTNFRVALVAGFTNTNVLQLNVNGTGLKNVFRKTQLGVSQAVGGEFIVGHPVTLVYDGTQYIIDGERRTVGKLEEFGGGTVPPGALVCDASAIARVGQFADLFTAIGTTWGVGNGTTTYNIPDFRGVTSVGRDTVGRITVAGGNFDASVIGALGGAQNHAQTVAEMAAHGHVVNDPGHTHGFNISIGNSGGGTSGGGGVYSLSFSGLAINSSGVNGLGVTLQGSGGGTAAPIVQPTGVVNKIIYF